MDGDFASSGLQDGHGSQYAGMRQEGKDQAWERHYDEASGCYYWINTMTGDSQWEAAPMEAMVVVDPPASEAAVVSPAVSQVGSSAAAGHSHPLQEGTAQKAMGRVDAPASETAAASSVISSVGNIGMSSLRWQAVWSKSKQKVYYFNRETQKTSWEPPDEPFEPLPDGTAAPGAGPVALPTGVGTTPTPSRTTTSGTKQPYTPPIGQVAAGGRSGSNGAGSRETPGPLPGSSAGPRRGSDPAPSPIDPHRVAEQLADRLQQQREELQRAFSEERRRTEEAAQAGLAEIRKELAAARQAAADAAGQAAEAAQRERARADAEIERAARAGEQAAAAREQAAAAAARLEAQEGAQERVQRERQEGAAALREVQQLADKRQAALEGARRHLERAAWGASAATGELRAAVRAARSVPGSGSGTEAGDQDDRGGEEKAVGHGEGEGKQDDGEDEAGGSEGTGLTSAAQLLERRVESLGKQAVEVQEAAAAAAARARHAIDAARQAESSAKDASARLVEEEEARAAAEGRAEQAAKEAREVREALRAAEEAHRAAVDEAKAKSEAEAAAQAKAAQGALASRPLPPGPPTGSDEIRRAREEGRREGAAEAEARLNARVEEARREAKEEAASLEAQTQAQAKVSADAARQGLQEEVRSMRARLEEAEAQATRAQEASERQQRRAEAAEQRADSAREEAEKALEAKTSALQAAEAAYRAELKRALDEAAARFQEQKQAAVSSAEAAERQRLQARVAEVEQAAAARSQAAAEEAAAAERKKGEAQAAALRADAESARQQARREATLRRAAHNKVLELQGNIRVFARIRPVLEVDRRAGEAQARDVTSVQDDGKVELRFSKLEALGEGGTGAGLGMTPGAAGASEERHAFAFDRAFGPGSRQEEVWAEVAPMVQSVADGYNGCIFAYGQTGSGKTHTMEGVPEDPGVNRRALQMLVDVVVKEDRGEVEQGDKTGADTPRSDRSGGSAGASTLASQSVVRPQLLLSVLEIHNEKVRDLLAPRGRKGADSLDLRASRDGGVRAEGLTHVRVRSQKEAQALLLQAGRHRSVGGHDMNAHSSRSHLVVTATLTMPRPGGKVTSSRLHLVDLAGSERVRKTGAGGARLKEAQHINKSLSALGNVVEALASRQRAAGAGGSASGGGGHVPFRNSKLTHLLQGALSGNSKVLMFVNASPSLYNASETLSSLKFALRCRAVRLGVARRGVQDKWQAEAEMLRRRVRELERQLAAGGAGAGGT